MSQSITTQVSTEQQSEQIAARFVEQLCTHHMRPLVVYLVGELGAGKSVFARSLLRALGVSPNVKSPTYTLVEQYELGSNRCALTSAAHLDLYRLVDPEELYFIGFDEIQSSCDLLLVEWPDKGIGLLPEATHEVTIEYLDNGHANARNIAIIEH